MPNPDISPSPRLIGIVPFWIYNVRILGYGGRPNEHIPPGTVGDMEVLETSQDARVLQARFHPGVGANGSGLVVWPRWQPIPLGDPAWKGAVGIVETVQPPLSWLLYVFRHAGRQQAVWLHKIEADGELIRGPGYMWRCSCGANINSLGKPLTVELLHDAWAHFDAHLGPEAVPLRAPMARWWRGGQEPDLDAMFVHEVQRILGHEPELFPIEAVHVCGRCGEPFKISEDDPHWSTSKGPICPKEPRS